MSPGSRFSRLVDRIQQPEHTGRNRCVPCTIVNVAFAAVFGLALAAISGPLGLAVFAAGISLIYLRGYLVPGTPTLTKRYLPDRVLELFDKGPDPRPRSSPSSALDPGEGGAATADPERLLRSLDAVEPCESEDDLCLTDAFESAWYAWMDLEDGPGADAVARLVDAPEESIRIHGTSDGGDGDGGGRGSVSVSVSSHSGLSSNPTPDPDSDQGSASADGQRSGRWH